MTKPEIGITISFQRHAALGETWDRVYAEALELAAEADRLGIRSIWVSEHHGEEDGYCPSPVVAGAALSHAAPNCLISQGIAIAPLYGHPLRLAEDLAVLDNLSGGRAQIGLGQGYRPEEFAAYGWNYKRRTRSFDETLDILNLAWTGERFDYDGDIHKVEGGLLRPAPVRPGKPPLWLGAAAPVSRARAIRHRAGLLIAPLIELEHAARQFADYDATSEAEGAGLLPHALMREIMIGDSFEEAVEAHSDALDLVYRQQYAPSRTGLTRKDPETGERIPLTLDDPYYLSREFMSARWFVGAPEQVADGINQWQQRFGLQHLIWQPKPPGLPLDRAVRSLERMAKEVMPRLA
ncbi:MAG: LLM class flavin-dependent oxidoreductase [Minwuia sp.]|uniref:LLM class flavin-dependent oxidoreductase n=1 Tax=Minwuia sp. TaxID=2493630 RepID=UPI003A8A4B8E